MFLIKLNLYKLTTPRGRQAGNAEYQGAQNENQNEFECRKKNEQLFLSDGAPNRIRTCGLPLRMRGPLPN